MNQFFSIKKELSTTSARAGVLHTDHGEIKTPFFMPVGTYGAVKTQSAFDISNHGSNILLSNTYHLYLRPGMKIIEEVGGLHKFMNWDGAILTDSGGFQIFSLEGFRKISEDGVTFQSHLDGSKHHFTPENIVDIQRSIGSDMMMMLDVCPSGNADYSTWVDALNTTTIWAKRAMKRFNETEPKYGFNQFLIPIVQGGTDEKLRIKSAEQLMKLDACAYAIGGLAVGEPKNEMLDMVEVMDYCLPKDKPRYLMGVGTPVDLIKNIARGVDMFDCVMPTRNARNAQLFTYDGKINIRNSKHANNFTIIDNKSNSHLSKSYTLSYLHHLFKVNEILGLRIATEHNICFYVKLMQDIRKSILDNQFESWANKFLERYDGSSL
tara:strand:- start:690 stop:1826 length:1137 start_codon:yes stop_codon:yes gene_type:complete